MCAICGIINKNERVERPLLEKMTRVMDYRGPDEEGFFLEGNVGLGHRRLSIIDLQTGQQPLANEDNNIFLVCNGEIYNFIELRENLEKQGHRFKTKSDSEVIIHLYEEKGIESLGLLRGMFSFGLWDNEKKLFFAARDRVGKKPFVYNFGENGNFIFASEIKALLLHPQVSREIDPAALDLFVTYQAVPSPRSIFRGIKKLPPAHYLLLKDGRLDVKRYWDVDFSKKIYLPKEDDYSELLWEKLNESVKIRMIADVPLGAFLSGGIDSSAVVGIMSGFSDRKIKTFSIGFQEESFSELKFAGKVARHFETEHTEFIVKPDILDILPKLVWHYNEPFGDSSMVPSYYVAREAKKFVTVALNGDGGDESLAGYTRYWQTLILEKLVNVGRKSPGSLHSFLNRAHRKYPQNFFSRIWKWVAEAEKYGYDYAYGRRLKSTQDNQKEKLYSPLMQDLVKGFDSMDILREHWNGSGDLKLLDRMLYCDQHFYLPDVLMVKMDIASMANGLEGRSPFLDHQFIETLASFPPNLKFKNFTSKYILKKKLKGFLPEEILKRKKMGFGVPLGDWFKGELKDYMVSTLLSEKALKRGFFDVQTLKNMVNGQVAGDNSHSYCLWNLLVFEIWCGIFIDGDYKG